MEPEATGGGRPGGGPRDAASDVHALIRDLLPVLAPSAWLDAATSEMVLTIGHSQARASTATVLERCADQPRTRWPSLVDEWVREVGDRASRAVGEMELFGDVRELLRLRIVPKLTPGDREGLVVVPAGDHFDAVVVIDHPRYGGPLTRDRAGLLGLRRLGFVMTNTHDRELADVEVRDQPLLPGRDVRVVTKPGSRYVSALLSEVHQFLPSPNEHGALVGAPSHSTLLIYPITSRAVEEVLPVFADVVAEMHAAADDPCASGVYWSHGERRLTPVLQSPDGPANAEFNDLLKILPDAED
ncbi:hypothetical protein DZF91_28410 [Actinomadura logoneensis]|uniref:Uncharacterized protein n=1 Tax=Actinomadura logoneensis TaxID=2293572 RepID=A0A372JE98_9ACTN|nr:hypothetical protein [Actinomadura logoneensis]RFU38300.1 hypothetical protein DZF91_28410 [Actinomadura logoneensis]